MRKFVACIAILACLYSPFRYGLIVFDEADRTPSETRGGIAVIADRNADQKNKNLIPPGKFFRRAFYSKDKYFILVLDQRKDAVPQVRFIDAFSVPFASTQPLFSYLRSPPLL